MLTTVVVPTPSGALAAGEDLVGKGAAWAVGLVLATTTAAGWVGAGAPVNSKTILETIATTVPPSALKKSDIVNVLLF